MGAGRNHHRPDRRTVYASDRRRSAWPEQQRSVCLPESSYRAWVRFCCQSRESQQLHQTQLFCSSDGVPAIAAQCSPFQAIPGSCSNLLGNAGRNTVVGPGLVTCRFLAVQKQLHQEDFRDFQRAISGGVLQYLESGQLCSTHRQRNVVRPDRKPGRWRGCGRSDVDNVAGDPVCAEADLVTEDLEVQLITTMAVGRFFESEEVAAGIAKVTKESHVTLFDGAVCKGPMPLLF